MIRPSLLFITLILALPLGAGCDANEGAPEVEEGEALNAYGDKVVPKSAHPDAHPMAGAPERDVPMAAEVEGDAVKNAPEFAAGAALTEDAGPDIHALTVQNIEGQPVALSAYEGKTLLIVNTASECGFTPQYKGLQALYSTYKDRGLVILGFPSNDFGGQEPGTEAEIKTFCQTKFGVEFPMFAKVHAKGPEKAPLYKALTEETPEGIQGEVKWNFTKFLVDPEGHVVARFESKVEPGSAELKEAIEAHLPKG